MKLMKLLLILLIFAGCSSGPKEEGERDFSILEIKSEEFGDNEIDDEDVIEAVLNWEKNILKSYEKFEGKADWQEPDIILYFKEETGPPGHSIDIFMEELVVSGMKISESELQQLFGILKIKKPKEE